MASFSMSGKRREDCNGHHVIGFAVDGVTVFNFIGWMQHTRKDMVALTDLDLNFGRAYCGFPVDRRYKSAGATEALVQSAFRAQQQTARDMMPMHLSAETRAYVLELQSYGAIRAHEARVCRDDADTYEQAGAYVNANEYLKASVGYQRLSADAFSKIAGVRGFYDTPTMDDAHAVEVEPSRIADPAPVDTRITVTLDVKDQFLRDVLCTAVEGGSNYWAHFRSVKRFKGEYGLEWEVVTVYEVGDSDASHTAKHVVGLPELREGVRRVIMGDMTDKASHANCHPSNGATLLQAVVTDDAGNVDADLADLVLQAACFGHIVYG